MHQNYTPTSNKYVADVCKMSFFTLYFSIDSRALLFHFWQERKTLSYVNLFLNFRNNFRLLFPSYVRVFLIKEIPSVHQVGIWISPKSVNLFSWKSLMKYIFFNFLIFYVNSEYLQISPSVSDFMFVLSIPLSNCRPNSGLTKTIFPGFSCPYAAKKFARHCSKFRFQFQ